MRIIVRDMQYTPDPENNFAEEQEAFLEFIGDIPASDLARAYSSYRFLAAFGNAADIWKRDACRAELQRRDSEALKKIEEKGSPLDVALLSEQGE